MKSLNNYFHVLWVILIHLCASTISAQNYEQNVYAQKDDNGKIFLVNIYGERLTESVYDACRSIHPSPWAVLEKNKMYGVVDYNGREIIPFKYLYISKEERENQPAIFVVQYLDGTWGSININNHIIIGQGLCDYFPELDYLQYVPPIECNAFKKGEKYGVISLYTGRIFVPLEYEDLRRLENNPYEYEFRNKHNSWKDRYFAKKNGKWGVIDLNNKIIVPFEFDMFYFYADNDTFVGSKGGMLCWYHNKQEKKLCALEEIVSLCDRRLEYLPIFRFRKLVKYSTKYSDKFGFINVQTGTMMSCVFDCAPDYINGYGCVQKGTSCAVMSADGKLMCDYKLPTSKNGYYGEYTADYCSYYVNNSGSGVVDKYGTIVVPFKYDKIFLNYGWTYRGVNQGLFCCQLDGKYGVVDIHNNTVIPIIYDNIWLVYGGGLVIVEKNKKKGLINLNNNGKVVIPCEYDEVDTDDSTIRHASPNYKGRTLFYAEDHNSNRRIYYDDLGNRIGEDEKYGANGAFFTQQYYFSQQLPDVDQDIPICPSIDNKRFAVIIANEEYQESGISNIKFAKNDGKIFKEYCKNTLGIPEKNIRYVENATLNQIRSSIRWANERASAYDGEAKIVFYYTGHGVPNEETNNSFLLPVDGIANDTGSAYSLDELYKQLGEMPAKQTLVFLDACFSGTSKEGNLIFADTKGVAIVAKPATLRGNMIVLSAAQGNETAFSYKKKKHSLFSYFLFKKLKETKGNVTIDELGTYINKNVRQQSISEMGRIQTPTLKVSEFLFEDWRSLKLR